MRKKWLVPLILVLVIFLGYFWPVPKMAFSQVYAKVPVDQTASLQTLALP
jgi:hypothetical protein